MTCKDFNNPFRLYAIPNIMGILEIRTNMLEHSLFWQCYLADYGQINSRMITDIVENR
jgi:hypothetical protein